VVPSIIPIRRLDANAETCSFDQMAEHSMVLVRWHYDNRRHGVQCGVHTACASMTHKQLAAIQQSRKLGPAKLNVGNFRK
jgi:hypothetical protein